ncbi:hypothetical protein [Francisella sp. SYW-9]|uniref:hypothetical protein n=1 Tax=Francisella sp. SYW-9 TaxID=2610888 RepID=UPI00123D247E|nr:hypothetical protein [Francisella sp. SYW-9]
MSDFIAIDGQKMTLAPNSHPAANLSAPSPTHDAVFLQVKLSAESGPVDLKEKLPYYDLGTSTPGQQPVNFKLEYGEFDAISQTISLHLRTNKTIAAELNAGLTKVLKGGAKAQLSVELAVANDKQTVDQANKGTIVQYFDPQGAKFTMCEEQTRQFQELIAYECGDSYLRTATQNETELTGTIVLSGKWEKGTPVSTWSGDSTKKVVIGVDAGGK